MVTYVKGCPWSLFVSYRKRKDKRLIKNCSKSLNSLNTISLTNPDGDKTSGQLNAAWNRRTGSVLCVSRVWKETLYTPYSEDLDSKVKRWHQPLVAILDQLMTSHPAMSTFIFSLWGRHLPLPPMVKQQGWVTGQQFSLSPCLCESGKLSVKRERKACDWNKWSLNKPPYNSVSILILKYLVKTIVMLDCVYFELSCLTFSMLASLLSSPCTSSTAKLSVCKEGVSLGAAFPEETVDRSISPSRSAIDICRGTQYHQFNSNGINSAREHNV